MAQAKATAKHHRLMMRGLARLGATARARRMAQADSERRALDLRQTPTPPTAPAQVTFLVPMVGAHHVGDWPMVCARLITTLHSFLAQDDPRWRAVICCQDKPDLPDDPRITWLPFDDPTPGNDKWRKLAALCAHLPNLPISDGYVMSFDADDLLRQGTVAEMLNRKARGGYLVQSGFVLDHATSDVGLADAPDLRHPLRKPFWKLCGSCAALRLDPQNPDAVAFATAMTGHEHRMFPYLAALSGRALTPLSRPSVLYVLNHGENFGARRGRVGFKTRFVQRFKLTDAATQDILRRDFPPIDAPD